MQPLSFAAADGVAASPAHDTRTSPSTLLLPVGGAVAEDFLVPAGVTAIATGPLHVLASRSIVVDGILLGAPGAPIHLESAGDIVVRGAVLGGDAAEGAGFAAADARRLTGSDGADAGDVILTAERVTLLPGAHIAAGAGGDGADVVVDRIRSGAENDPTVVGGRGGDGGNVVIRSDTAELDGVLVSGAGGRGGDGVVDLRDADHHDLHATSVGGDGGGSGSVLLPEAYHASEAFRAIVAPAGAGGDASAHATPADTAIRGCEATPGEHGLAGGTNPVATGGPGGPGYRCSGEKDGMNGGNGGKATARSKNQKQRIGDCTNGGHATAYGGAGGRGGNGGTGAWGKDAKFGNDGGWGGQGGSGGRGGAGGTARAFAGNGGTGQSCPSGTTNGGNAYAEGGVGGNGGNGGNGGPGGDGGQGGGTPPCSGRGGNGGIRGMRGAGGDKGGAEATAGKPGSNAGVWGHSTSLTTRAGTPGAWGQPGAKGADGPPPYCLSPCCDAVYAAIQGGATEAGTWLDEVDVGVAGGLRANATDLRAAMEDEAALIVASSWYEHGTRLREYDDERDQVAEDCRRTTSATLDQASPACVRSPEPCAWVSLCQTEVPETPDVPWESVPDHSLPTWPSTPNEPADPDPIEPPGDPSPERNRCRDVNWRMQECKYKVLPMR